MADDRNSRFSSRGGFRNASSVDKRVHALINPTWKAVGLGFESSSKVHRVIPRSNGPCNGTSTGYLSVRACGFAWESNIFFLRETRTWISTRDAIIWRGTLCPSFSRQRSILTLYSLTFKWTRYRFSWSHVKFLLLTLSIRCIATAQKYFYPIQVFIKLCDNYSIRIKVDNNAFCFPTGSHCFFG